MSKREQSGRWKMLAQHIRSRNNHLDMYEFQMYGRRIDSQMVHHIYPESEYPEYFWCEWNLIPVSYATHNRLHKPDGSLSKAGLDLMKRTKPQ